MRLSTLIVIPAMTLLSVCSEQAPGRAITSIDWDDGDSGDIDGERFRLYSVDAPETGGIGARGGAKCEAERERGFASKDFMVALTKNARLVVTESFGYDETEKPRLLVNISADGRDVSEAGIVAGHLKPWLHDGSKKLQDKPDWCGRG